MKEHTDQGILEISGPEEAEPRRCFFDDFELVSMSEPVFVGAAKEHGADQEDQWWDELRPNPFDHLILPGSSDQRVETSGLIYLRDLADAIQKDKDCLAQEKRANVPVLIPATLPAVRIVEPEPAQRPSRLLSSLAAGAVAAFVVAVGGFVWSAHVTRAAAAAEPTRMPAVDPPAPHDMNEPLPSPVTASATRKADTAQAQTDGTADAPRNEPAAGQAQPGPADGNSAESQTPEPASSPADSDLSRTETRSRRSRTSADDEPRKADEDQAEPSVAAAPPAAKPEERRPAVAAVSQDDFEREALKSIVPAARRRAESSPSAMMATVARMAPTPAGQAAARGNGLAAALLTGAQQKNTDVAKAADRKPALPEQLSRRQMAPSLAKIQRRAKACLKQFGYANQLLTVRITISGASGRIASAKIAGRFNGTPVGACVKNRIKRVRFPRFSNSTQCFSLPLMATAD